MEQKKEYYAFISYKREDEKWAKWLQNKLEHYKFPTNLNGRTDLPKNIRPTFRDVTDLTPGLLAEEIDKALRSSEWLIVVCSPRSAKSLWVCKEAQTFIDLGRADHIIPFVIEGKPFSNESSTECYPEALLNLTGGRELLAANINEMGRDAAAIKVVARMFNLRFDTLWQRYNKEQKRKRLIWSLIAIFVTVLSFLISVWFYKANHEIVKGREKLLITQSRYLASEAQKEYNSGNITKAIRMALYALPNNIVIPDRPYVIEAEQILRRCEMRNTISQDTIICKSVFKHNACINSVTLSPNGKYIISASDDRTARVWNARTGKSIATLEHKGRVVSANFSPDSKFVVTSSNNIACIYDITTGKMTINPLVHDSCSVKSAIFSPDGKYIITRTNNDFEFLSNGMLGNETTYIWDAKTGAPIKSHITSVDFSVDGKYAVTSKGREIQIWDVSSSMPITKSIQHFSYVKSAMFTPNGEYIIVKSRKRDLKKYLPRYIHLNDTICVLDAKTGFPIVAPKIDNSPYNTTTFSKDGKYVVTSRTNLGLFDILKIMDFKTGELITKISHDSRNIKSAVFSSNGKFLIASSGRSVYIWNVLTGKQSYTLLDHNNDVKSTFLSTDDKQLITVTEDNTIYLWEFVNNQDNTGLFYNNDDFKYTVFSSKENISLRVSNKNDIYIWDLEKNIALIKLPRQKANLDYAVFSPNGEYVVTISSDNIARVWNTETGKLVNEIIQHKSEINSTVFSPDGKTFATASNDSTVCIWRVSTGTIIGTPLRHNRFVQKIAFSQNGNFIAAASGGDVYIWDVRTRRPTIYSPITHDSYVNFIVFNSDGKYLATSTRNCEILVWDIMSGKKMIKQYGGSDLSPVLNSSIFSPDGKSIVALLGDGMANVWNVSTGKCMTNALMHDDIIISAFFSPDGKYIVTSSMDKTACVWEVSTGMLKYEPLQHNSYVNYASFSSSGKYIITFAGYNTIRIWDASTGKSITDPILHSEWCNRALFTPNEKYFYVTESNGNIAQIWPFPSLQELIDKYNSRSKNDWSLSQEELEEYSLE